MPPWDKNLSNLRNVLAGLYWNIEEARRIVLEVGMNPAFIGPLSRSLSTWQKDLEEATHHDKVRAIIAKAREEYPRVQSLALAEQNLLLAVELPAIGEGAWRGPSSADQEIMGTLSTLRPISFLQRGLDVSRSVARVVLADGSSGSGFSYQE